MKSISFLTAPAHRPIERQRRRFVSLPAIQASFEHNDINYPLKFEILLKLRHFIENCNTQTLLLKMNDDKRPSPTQLLLDAIEKHDISTVSSLISNGSMNLNGEPLPLHRAAEFGRVEIMTMLLDAGADINFVDFNCNTACCVAILGNQFDALKLLVERGANLGVVDSHGRSLLSIVARRGMGERFVILLLDAGAPIDGLSNGLVMNLVNSVAVFNRLVARGVNFSAMRDERGATLCHHVAANVTREDDLRALVNVCSNDAVHAVDISGRTPIRWASSIGNESAMRVMVELGAEIDGQDNRGSTALIGVSCFDAQSSSVELLLALGADVNLVINGGLTACHFAVFHKSAALCALVAAGVDLDHPNKDGETPRMIAARDNVALPTTGEIDAARHRIAKVRLDLVRQRAFQICLGLQPLDINALQLCEILMHSFGALGSLIAFHQWWVIAVKVKHFRDHKQAI
jgi:ankyrin repeat protein